MNKLGTGGFLRTILQLGKIKISLPVALTGFLGYFRFSPECDLILLLTLSGILFMAMGSSTFNQVQEQDIDRLMDRTKNRPIPSGRISKRGALLTGLVLSVIGLVFLFLTGSPTAVLIGIFTLLWYNLVYTPLKRRTAFAVLPGAIIGALPPMIGWVAAGGKMTDPEIQLIAFFLFIGQMPHYWLLMMKSGQEFKGAGLPVITSIFQPLQLRNISFIWIVAAAVVVIMFPALGIIRTHWVSYLLMGIIAVFLIRMFLLSFRGDIMANWKQSFITVNLFYLFIILLLIADQWIEPYLYITHN